MSLILMTTLFYKALILQGKNWCWLLLGLKGLNDFIGIGILLKDNYKSERKIETTLLHFIKKNFIQYWVYILTTEISRR